MTLLSVRFNECVCRLRSKNLSMKTFFPTVPFLHSLG
uniref:Uncharacterized protein n=1 Tax=Anguilla anguilla TaxID=7936 RepID=A0A0E9TEJ8_ANGAN